MTVVQSVPATVPASVPATVPEPSLKSLESENQMKSKFTTGDSRL